MRRPWQRLNPSEVRGVWDHWKRGETLRAIGSALGLSENSLYQVVVRHGGVPPRPRRRCPRVLCLEEREEISRGLCGQESIRAIAKRLGRAPSTVSREIRRHSGAQRYRAIVGDDRAWRWATRPKPRRLATDPRLRRVIFAKIRADWSPQQISAWLKRTFPADPRMQLSHEAIYQSLYVQARGALKRELVQHLRRQRGLRRSGPKRTARTTGRIIDAVSIAERPPEAEDRVVPGHWEGDLLFGRPGSFMATLVERRSRYVVLVRVPSRESSVVARSDSPHPSPPRVASPITHVGPRHRDGDSSHVYHGHQAPSLLLRPPEPMAAGLERKHEWLTPSVLSERGRSQQGNAAPARCRCP
jgi:hypothetical protein